MEASKALFPIHETPPPLPLQATIEDSSIKLDENLKNLNLYNLSFA